MELDEKMFTEAIEALKDVATLKADVKSIKDNQGFQFKEIKDDMFEMSQHIVSLRITRGKLYGIASLLSLFFGIVGAKLLSIFNGSGGK